MYSRGHQPLGSDPTPGCGASAARLYHKEDSVSGAAATQRDDYISHCPHCCSALIYRAVKAALHRGVATAEHRENDIVSHCPTLSLGQCR